MWTLTLKCLAVSLLIKNDGRSDTAHPSPPYSITPVLAILTENGAEAIHKGYGQVPPSLPKTSHVQSTAQSRGGDWQE